MYPEQLARQKIDGQLRDAGWDVVSRDDYQPGAAVAVREVPMQCNKRCDYVLYIDSKAIAVLEAKEESNELGIEAAKQAEAYAGTPQEWYGVWHEGPIPLVYLANGRKICFRNLHNGKNSEYEELREMDSPKKMLKRIFEKSAYGALPLLDKRGLRTCQYSAEMEFERQIKQGKKRALAILATGAGKTYLACLAAYRFLNYTHVDFSRRDSEHTKKKVLFLVDRNNLARQTESECSLFKLTERGLALNQLYQIGRLRAIQDVRDDDIVISTIQKLYAVLTGQALPDESKDDQLDEYEFSQAENEGAAGEVMQLNGEVTLPPDHFQFIIVDECHRSIYGKWQSVLNYFKDAIILGLTATPTSEALDFFDDNKVEEYTYEKSVVDGVNVPYRIYRIRTEITENGGMIRKGDTVEQKVRRNGNIGTYKAGEMVDYLPSQLGDDVIVRSQIECVLTAYRDAIYTSLYPERERSWTYIPKTLIFARNDDHATEIVNAAKKIFGEKFSSGYVPERFVQKITYTAGDTDALIRELRSEKEFRIAVTVTLVATGTDVKPLEVVMFLNDVKSDVLYKQMKGRGCRTIHANILREVTPNATAKDCYYIVDAVGVTEHEKNTPEPMRRGVGGEKKHLNLCMLLEMLAHGDVSDDNLALLRDYCASIHRRYEDDELIVRHLRYFIETYNFSPRELAEAINDALERGTLPPFRDVSAPNPERRGLISCLIDSVQARKKLLEMQAGYTTFPSNEDTLVDAGFSMEDAKALIGSFEQYVTKNTDSIEALRNIYHSADALITRSMLEELRDALSGENILFKPFKIWKSYKILDRIGNVDEPDAGPDAAALTDLIQLTRYVYNKHDGLRSLVKSYTKNFELYCGQKQRSLSEAQRQCMRQIGDCVVRNGFINAKELNEANTDLWRDAIRCFDKNPSNLESEMTVLAKFILRAA